MSPSLRKAVVCLALATPALAEERPLDTPSEAYLSLTDLLFGRLREVADPPDPDRVAREADPPQPDLVALTVPGLAPAFHPRQTRYQVAAPRDGHLPITVAVGDPFLEVSVNGTRVEVGRPTEALARPGARIEVVVARGGREISRYTLDVVDTWLLPSALDFGGSLYLSGGEGIRRIRLSDDAQSTLPLPVAGETFLLAVNDDHTRLYATSHPEDAVTTFDLMSHDAIDHFSFGQDWSAGGLAVTPGGHQLHVLHGLTSVMATFDAHDLSAPAHVEYLPGIRMPMLATYRPGMLDLYVSDFWSDLEDEDPDTTHLAVRRPQVDWEAGEVWFGWAHITLPPSETHTDGDAGAGVAFLTELGLVVAVNTRGDEVVVLDEATRKPLARTATGAMPFFVAADPDADADQGRVFVAGLQSGSLSVYTVSRNGTGGATIVQEKRFNPCKDGNAIKPVFGDDPAVLYLLCTDGVAVLDADALEVERHIPVAGAWQKDMVWAAR